MTKLPLLLPFITTISSPAFATSTTIAPGTAINPGIGTGGSVIGGGNTGIVDPINDCGMYACPSGKTSQCSSSCTAEKTKCNNLVRESGPSSAHVITITTPKINYGSYYEDSDYNCYVNCTCTSTTSYECAAGYYGNPTSTTSGCTKCPNGPNGESTKSAQGTTDKCKCYIPANTTATDIFGTFKYTTACYNC